MTAESFAETDFAGLTGESLVKSDSAIGWTVESAAESAAVSIAGAVFAWLAEIRNLILVSGISVPAKVAALAAVQSGTAMDHRWSAGDASPIGASCA